LELRAAALPTRPSDQLAALEPGGERSSAEPSGVDGCGPPAVHLRYLPSLRSLHSLAGHARLGANLAIPQLNLACYRKPPCWRRFPAASGPRSSACLASPSFPTTSSTRRCATCA